MCPHGYYTLVRESKEPAYLRLRLGQQAKRSGVKAAARLLATTPKTVRKWRARFDGTLASLTDRSRAPLHGRFPRLRHFALDSARRLHRVAIWVLANRLETLRRPRKRGRRSAFGGPPPACGGCHERKAPW
jgi:hypothetical protein